MTGSSSPPPPTSPPAYRDLYPEQKGSSSSDWSLKKQSEIQAAADAAADLHFEHEKRAKAGRSVSAESRLDRPIERIELSRDRKLFFFWVSP